MAPRKLAAGNWKMNGDLAALAEIDALTAAQAAPGWIAMQNPRAPIRAISRLRS